ncbi:hypothetical protein PSA01_38060 [Pseudonocardia saturnea]|uniref:Uncharacterized protein n=1 Tax=Pseudonocardia saturnea TaxID=33909 RepID=A0ABQ0S1J2_9PSEU|nr:hypothetical protein Pdca_23760 [Pseudonocardia autotrophica]GEC26777.1 hypothetical protein PSA01_38060 [Pseudonocardia saturnea]
MFGGLGAADPDPRVRERHREHDQLGPGHGEQRVGQRERRHPEQRDKQRPAAAACGFRNRDNYWRRVRLHCTRQTRRLSARNPTVPA